MELFAAACFVLMIFYFNYPRVAREFKNDEQPKVIIPTLGKVVGSKMTTVSGKQFQAFRGIPYGEPPVGYLRFKDPVPKKTWGAKELDATKEGPICLQYVLHSTHVKGQEDCLMLNVYTPSVDNVDNPLPVMVWIHGGGWFTGSGNGETDLYGPGYLLDRDIVLVTINYRLGPLGFLSTGDAEGPGNYGLLDQTLALKWVHDHIKHFGGNPNLVTLFGGSAGAASVEFHMLSPLSKGLFHRAIAQSGSSRCPWALQTNVGVYSRELGKYLNCSMTTSKTLLNCLRTKRGKDLIITKRVTMPAAGLDFNPIAFGPRIDVERESPFLPDEPEKLITTRRFTSVPLIAGVTENEGSLVGATLKLLDGKKLKAFNKDPITSVMLTIGMEKRKNGYEIASKVYNHYFVKNKGKKEYHQLGELMSDYAFFKGIDESVMLFSRYSNERVYYYNYGHRGQLSISRLLNYPAGVDFGVPHGDDIFLIFTSSRAAKMTNPKDIRMSNTMLDLWTSFASDGVPRSKQVLDEWKPVKKGKTRYLKFTAPRPKLVNGSMPFKPNLVFWDRLMNSALYKINS